MRRWGDEISSAPVGSVHEDADRLCEDATEQVDDQEREEKRPAEDDRGLEDPGPALGAGMPAGFPDLSNMPKGLDELPPGLADIDLSKLKFPKN